MSQYANGIHDLISILSYWHIKNERLCHHRNDLNFSTGT